MSNEAVLSLLDSGNYRTYNCEIARALNSVNAAILLSELVNRYQYHVDQETISTFNKYHGEWFYYTVKKCEERTALTKDEQSTAIDILEKKGLISKSIIGMPAKRYFQLKIEEINKFTLGLKKVLRNRKSRQQDSGKTANMLEEKPSANKEHYDDPKKDSLSSRDEKERERIFSSLKIGTNLKKDLLSTHSDEVLSSAVKKTLAWKDRRSDEAALLTVLARPDSFSDSRQPEVDKRAFLASLQHLDCDTIQVGPDYIGFISGPMKSDYYKLTDKDFVERVTHELQTRGYKV